MTEIQNHPNENPLESWKEIAAYLKRDVRTVKRWEKSEGLPVHRQMHQARGSVFAYPSELETWKGSRELRLDTPSLITPWRRAVSAAGSALVLLVALATVSSGPILTPTRAAAQQFKGIVNRQVWAGPGVNTWGAVSPDGRYLTFVDGLNLAVRDLATGKNRLLSSSGSLATRELAEYSVFSPDSQQIAYDWHSKDDTWDLAVIGLDGSGLRVLVHRDNKDFICPVGWSPDGKRILTAFFRTESSGVTGEIAFASVTDGSVQVIKPTHKTALSTITEMSLSPDGRYIAYHAPAANGSSQNDIFLLSSDGSRDFPLVQHPANDRAPAWTPDGQGLLFVSDRGGTSGFWMIDVLDGKPRGEPKLVKADVGQFGGRIGFTRQGAYYYALSTSMEDVYIAELDPETGKIQGEPKILAARFVGSNSEPAWSPDGQFLAYYRHRGADSWAPGSRTIVIRSFQTGEERELPNNLILFGRVRWFPDGGSLLASVFRGEKDWRIDYYRVDVTTGEASLILQREEGAGTPWPGLSPDGKRIFFAGDGFLRSYQIDTQQEIELYRPVPGQRVRKSVLVSPDGGELALVEYQGPFPPTSIVQLIPTGGGKARELLRVPWPGFISGNGALEWAPDGRHLLIVKDVSPSVSQPTKELLRVPVGGGEPQKVGLIAERLRSPSIHPEGSRIAFGAVSSASAGEIWVMDNFLSTLKASQ
jgi:Tol biopolymer transport system component